MNLKMLIRQPQARSFELPQNLKYSLRLLRCKDWSVQNGVFLLGAFFADDFLAHGLDFVIASLLLSCSCLAYGYALNEFFDELREKLTDDLSFTTGLHRFIYFFLALALIVSWQVSQITFALVFLIGITVWLHSSPPFRLKRKLFWRLFLNSLGFGLFFLTGASLDNHISTAELCMGAFIFGLYLPLELIHVLAHMDADRGKGLPTFAIVHGEKRTIILALVFLVGLILFSAILCEMKFISLFQAGWSILNLSLLLLSLLTFYKQHNDAEIYRKLRLRTKITCAIYGMGLLAIFVGKF